MPFIEIKNCEECPHCTTEKYYTSDSFETCRETLCTKISIKPRRIAVLDWNERKEPIPKWCPLNKVSGSVE